MGQDISNIVAVPVKEIWADPEFNCRGFIAPIDVVTLAKDIDDHGLQQPIVVRPIREGESKKPEHKWKLITGHRRHKAFEVLKKEKIPCAVNSIISEADSLIMNLGENLHRKDLNIMQEANALKRLKVAGFAASEVAAQLCKSATWVSIRYLLLELPDEIREAAAAGYVNQKQIKEIHGLKDYKKQIEATKRIKIAKARGEKSPRILRPKRDMFKRKPREVDGIFFMQRHIYDSIGNNFGTRCLAWAAGEISDLELFRDIQAIADKVGISYNISYKKAEKEEQ